MTPLDQLLREYVTPGLRQAGWAKTGKHFVAQAANGDRAIITFRSSYATQATFSRFFVEVGILTVPMWQMRAYMHDPAKTSLVDAAGFKGRVLPSIVGLEDLGGMWEAGFADVTIIGPKLKQAVVDEVAPMLVSSLDRDVLLTWIEDKALRPTSVGWMPGPDRLDVLADVAPLEQLDAEIERLRTKPYVNRGGYINGLIQRFSYLADRYPERYSDLLPEVAELRAEFDTLPSMLPPRGRRRK